MGACFLIGGLTLAWAERNFYAEVHRNYSAMRMLYSSADFRLKKILERLESMNVKDEVLRRRSLEEAQDILFNLGCEALNENAEWLILHRARPLEPFMAG